MKLKSNSILMKSFSEPLHCILQDFSYHIYPTYNNGSFPNSASENIQSSYNDEQDTYDTMVNVYVISSIKYLNVFGETVVLFNLLAGISSWNMYVGSKQY